MHESTMLKCMTHVFDDLMAIDKYDICVAIGGSQKLYRIDGEKNEMEIMYTSHKQIFGIAVYREWTLAFHKSGHISLLKAGEPGYFNRGKTVPDLMRTKTHLSNLMMFSPGKFVTRSGKHLYFIAGKSRDLIYVDMSKSLAKFYKDGAMKLDHDKMGSGISDMCYDLHKKLLYSIDIYNILRKHRRKPASGNKLKLRSYHVVHAIASFAGQVVIGACKNNENYSFAKKNLSSLYLVINDKTVIDECSGFAGGALKHLEVVVLGKVLLVLSAMCYGYYSIHAVLSSRLLPLHLEKRFSETKLEAQMLDWHFDRLSLNSYEVTLLLASHEPTAIKLST